MLNIVIAARNNAVSRVVFDTRGNKAKVGVYNTTSTPVLASMEMAIATMEQLKSAGYAERAYIYVLDNAAIRAFEALKLHKEQGTLEGLVKPWMSEKEAALVQKFGEAVVSASNNIVFKKMSSVSELPQGGFGDKVKKAVAKAWSLLPAADMEFVSEEEGTEEIATTPF